MHLELILIYSTNIGFKLFKSGDKKGIDKQEAKKL